jgi:hypothetical protein
MKIEYITNDSQKSLAPLFSAKMLAITFNMVWILALILLIWMPRKDLQIYVNEQVIPLNFLAVFVATLLMNTYVNLRCGRGEIFESPILVRPERERLTTFEEERAFFSYGLVEFLIHTLLLLMILLPLLLVSAAISAISPRGLFEALSIIFTTSLLCRLFGFLMFISWKNRPRIGYYLARLFFYFFIFATGIFAPYANPVLMVYSLYNGRDISTPFSFGPYTSHMLIMTLAILILSLANQLRVRHNILGGKSN